MDQANRAPFYLQRFHSRTRAVTGLILVGVLAVLPMRAHADPDPNAQCVIRAIRGSRGEGGIDPQLGKLGRQLTKPPFTEWKTFRQIALHQVMLTPGSSTGFTMPDDHHGTVTYKQHLHRDATHHRVRLQLEVRKGDEIELSTVFVLDEGGTVLSAGHRRGGDILIVGVTCQTDL